MIRQIIGSVFWARRREACLGLMITVFLSALSVPVLAADNCWQQAGSRYGVNPWLLYAIARKESSLRANAVNQNRDGTEDLGIMQINSRHLSRLAQYGITRQRLLTEPCLAINIAAWLIADNFARYGRSWRSVGMYNAGTANTQGQEIKRLRYARDVEVIYANSIGVATAAQ